MNVLDLFSGIGGFSLGLERAGMRTVAFCEIEPFCRAVLRKHWPNVPIYEDVRTLTADRLAADGIVQTVSDAEHDGSPAIIKFGETKTKGRLQQPQRYSGVDIICGGFPCQDISVAGKGAGIEGSRSGLWSEYARIIGEVRPRYVIVENVSALLGRGLDRVLGDLAALGFDAEWHCIPASAVGAPHRRDRLWLVAHPRRISGEWRGGERRGTKATGTCDRPARSSEHTDNVADASWDVRPEQTQGGTEWERTGTGGQSISLADANEPRLERRLAESLRQCAEQRFAWAGGFQGWNEANWFAESGMGRVSNGTANRVDRLRSLGNAVVPQIPEIIGRAIMETLNAR